MRATTNRWTTLTRSWTRSGFERRHFSFGTQKDGTIVELKDGDKTWYDYYPEAFGTKWEPYESCLDEQEGCLTYSFQSAWSPPVAFVRKLQEHNPHLVITLRFEEGGMAFMGEVTADGVVNDAEYPDFPDDDAENYDELLEAHQEVRGDYLYG